MVNVRQPFSNGYYMYVIKQEDNNVIIIIVSQWSRHWTSSESSAVGIERSNRLRVKIYLDSRVATGD